MPSHVFHNTVITIHAHHLYSTNTQSLGSSLYADLRRAANTITRKLRGVRTKVASIQQLTCCVHKRGIALVFVCWSRFAAHVYCLPPAIVVCSRCYIMGRTPRIVWM